MCQRPGDGGGVRMAAWLDPGFWRTLGKPQAQPGAGARSRSQEQEPGTQGRSLAHSLTHACCTCMHGCMAAALALPKPSRTAPLLQSHSYRPHAHPPSSILIFTHSFHFTPSTCSLTPHTHPHLIPSPSPLLDTLATTIPPNSASPPPRRIHTPNFTHPTLLAVRCADVVARHQLAPPSARQ